MTDGQQHTYPSNYPPGTNWATDAAWELLDQIKPGVIPDHVRFFLAGAFAGRLSLEYGYAVGLADGINAWFRLSWQTTAQQQLDNRLRIDAALAALQSSHPTQDSVAS
jgi:hypothetical protein